MNEELLKPFTKEEIFYALKHMGPLKAPSPYGFLAMFFKKIGDHWETTFVGWF
jgi:hypothetical protein